MKHEAVAVFAGQGVDDLLVTVCAEGGNNERLGFPTREQCRAMGSGKHTRADLDGPNRAGVSPVDAGLPAEDLTSNDSGFKPK